MKQNDESMQEPHRPDVRADAVRASLAAPALYAATVTAALFEESMRWIDQWYSLSARLCHAGPVRGSPYDMLFGRMAGVDAGGAQRPGCTRAEVADLVSAHGPQAPMDPEAADVDAFEEVDDLPPITKEAMLAHPRSMEFNFALHDMQERIFAGLPMDGDPCELPGYDPALGHLPTDRKPASHEL